MEFQPVTKNVELFGVTESKKMSIAATAKVFYAFISGLYTRKTEAVVRETCANARDGHTFANKLDVPFYVHAPTVWEPFYKVRDYGTGMTHEFVMNLYSVIGYSTKEQSNDEVGTWGFGSKSPYAKTSQFTVTVWQDGEQRVYNCYINADGEPDIAFMDQLASDEPTGVEVSFDVKEEDFGDFADQIRWAAQQHPHPFTSNINLGVEPLQEDGGTSLFYCKGIEDGPYVEIGCVWYKIDFDQLPSNVPGRFLNKSVIRTKIGELAVPPSRESLEYTAKTKKRLVEILNDVTRVHRASAEAKAMAAETRWDAALLAQDASLTMAERYFIGAAMTRFGVCVDDLRTFDSQIDYISFSLDAKSHIRRRTVEREAPARTPGQAVVIWRPHLDRADPSTRLRNWMRVTKTASALLVEIPTASARVRSEAVKYSRRSRADRKTILKNVFKESVAQIEALERFAAEFGAPHTFAADQVPRVARIKAPDRKTICYDPPAQGTSRCWYRAYAVDASKDGAIDILVPLTDRMSRFGSEAIKAAAKIAGVALGNVKGISKSNVKAFLRQHPTYRLCADVFNAKTVDVDKIYARLDNLKYAARGAPTMKEAVMMRDRARAIDCRFGIFDAFVDRQADYVMAYHALTRRETPLDCSERTCREALYLIGDERNATPVRDIERAAFETRELMVETFPRFMNHGPFACERSALAALAGEIAGAQMAAVDLHMAQMER